MRDAGLKNTKSERDEWENELWSYIGTSNGINCPLYKCCQLKRKSNHCIGISKDLADRMKKLIDSDTLRSIPFDSDFIRLPICIGCRRISELVGRLARSYRDSTGISELPIPIDIIKKDCRGLPIEVRLVPLKSCHGAVWRLKDSWVIHLNSKDTSARRRFTLYHEVFHILAHCKTNPVFQKASGDGEGAFNELMADHFSANMLMPPNLLKKKWQEIKDVSKVAEIFDVPETVVYCGLKFLRLI